MTSDELQVYDAWLSAAELPYDWLIPLLYEKKDSHAVYEELIVQKNPMEEMIPAACRNRLAYYADPERMDTFRDMIRQHRIRSLTIMDVDYPHCLRELPDPPGILFSQGDTGCLKTEKAAAMVGSRAASYAGLKASRKISKELSENGVVIISGLAYGIDAECHRGCIEGGSPTIAVMGCGLDQMYPAENSRLKQDILSSGGLILSEYVPGAKPVGHHFPYRNRIISGLARIVILMEAKIRSGSMTTISHALKQGKEVYAYPGDPSSQLSEANRQLLREGARYFSRAADILEDMNWLDNQSHVGQNSDCSAPRPLEDASETAVFRALLKGELGFDELVQSTGLSSSALMSTLTVMQIKKRVEPIPGKKYRLVQL